jgi:hypothetical protein
VQQHVKDDPKLAEAPLLEGVDAMLSGDYIKLTVGFEKLGAATDWFASEEPDPCPARQVAVA